MLIIFVMERHRKSTSMMLSELAVASWQTVALRTSMIAGGTCSASEYQRMVMEKVSAAQRSAVAMLLPGRDPTRAILAPWHRAASANAKRLRRRKR
jgi:hypothetical protein